LTISGVVVTGNVAQVTVQEGNKPPDRSMTLEENDGEWRIISFTF
jgi:hypothetical protein